MSLVSEAMGVTSSAPWRRRLAFLGVEHQHVGGGQAQLGRVQVLADAAGTAMKATKTRGKRRIITLYVNGGSARFIARLRRIVNSL
jgi:hypothetical protein